MKTKCPNTIFNALKHLAPERIVDSADDDAERIRAVRLQPAGQRTGDIAQVDGNLFNPFDGLGGDGWMTA